MNPEDREPRGRTPSAKRWGQVSINEMMSSYSDKERISVASSEMEKFLQGSGIEDATIKGACSDPLVFGLFTLSRLFEMDVHAEIGNWLADEEWQRVEKWKNLCNRWHKRWEKPRLPEPNQGNFMAVWRLACMVEGWRLLDEFYLRGPQENRHLIPSADEISTAALAWLSDRGVVRRSLDSIRNKDKREFEKIALGWIPQSGLKKPPGPLFSDGQEPTAFMRENEDGVLESTLTDEELEELARRMDEYESTHSNTTETELDALRGLD